MQQELNTALSLKTNLEKNFEELKESNRNIISDLESKVNELVIIFFSFTKI